MRHSTENRISISTTIANRAAEALVDRYNDHQGKQSGSVRLIAFRSLYEDLVALGQQHCIASAIKPTDFPQDKWFVRQ